MGKLAVVLTAGTGTTAVSVGGFYLVQQNSVGNGNVGEGGDGSQIDTVRQSEGEKSEKPVNKELKFDSLDKFKDTKGYKCSSLEDIYFPDKSLIIEMQLWIWLRISPLI